MSGDVITLSDRFQYKQLPSWSRGTIFPGIATVSRCSKIRIAHNLILSGGTCDNVGPLTVWRLKRQCLFALLRWNRYGKSENK